MKIRVDTGACPGAIREILFRAAERTGVELTLVANRPVRAPPSRSIRSIVVASGFDVADEEILAGLGPAERNAFADRLDRLLAKCAVRNDADGGANC